MKTITLLFCSCLIAAAMQAQILRVPAVYSTIQEAVDAADYGDTVLVDTGTYQENIMIRGNNKTITLASNFIFSGDTNDIINTIIDASEPQNPNYGMAIYIFNQDSTLDTRIIGITITGGTGYYHNQGGGIVVTLATPVIESNQILNCSILGNYTRGGGISVTNNYDPDKTAFIINNVIRNCLVEGDAEALGGAIALYNVRAVTENNLICQNTLKGNESTLYLGGGIWSVNPVEGSIISSNDISGNILPDYAYCRGGGIFIGRAEDDTITSGLPMIDKNRIINNSAKDGGGVYCYNIPVKLINNFISGNLASNSGGAIRTAALYDTTSVSEIINNTITANMVSGQWGTGGSMEIEGSSNFILMNNIFYDNHAGLSDEIHITSSVVKIHNCDINKEEIEGTWSGTDNFYGDPRFINAMEWDSLDVTAPCSNTGRDSITVFERTFYAPESCINNNPRPLNGAVDVGACEVEMFYAGVDESTVISRQSSVVSYPNPFSSFTTIEYELDHATKVNLAIYNYFGQQLAVLVDEQQIQGKHHIQWNAEGVPAGIYFYRLTTDDCQLTTGKLVKY